MVGASESDVLCRHQTERGQGVSSFCLDAWRRCAVQVLLSLYMAQHKCPCTGWAIGDVDIEDYELRTTAVKLQVAVVNIEYR